MRRHNLKKLVLTKAGLHEQLAAHGDDNACEDDRNHAHQLDQDVERRSGRILKGITDGVTGDAGLMGSRALAAEVATFDVLLRVVPGATSVIQHNREDEAGRQATYQQAHDAGNTEDQADDNRNNDSQDRRDNHLALGTSGANRDATCVVGLLSSVHDAGECLELTANFLNHGTGCASDCFHSHGRKDQDHHRAQEQTRKDCWIHQRNVVGGHEVRHRGVVRADERLAERPSGFDCLGICFGSLTLEECQRTLDVNSVTSFSRQTAEPDTNLFQVTGEQGHCGQSRRTDCKALSGCSRRIAERVQGIGTLTHILRQMGHFGIAASVIGDRAKRVCCKSDAQSGQHADGRKADAVQPQGNVVETAGCPESYQNGCDNRYHRDTGRIHPNCQAINYSGSGPHSTLLRNTLGGFVFVAGEVFSHLTDDNTSKQPSDYGNPHALGNVAEVRKCPDRRDNQDRCAERSNQ